MITPRNQQPKRSARDDAEYRANYTSAEYINALYALDSGWTGKGVLVGILDDGANVIPELDGQVDRELSRDFGGQMINGVLQEREGGENTGDDTSTHGTPIAAIIAAKNDGVGVQGFVPDATIVALRVDALRDGERLYGFRQTDAIRYAIEKDIMLLNMSLGRVEPDIVSAPMQDVLREYREFGGLLINSAGNDAAPNPSNYLDLTDDNAEAILFVVALNPSYTDHSLASYSNACGAVMERCVAAAGTNITHDVNGQIVAFSGTSSAAPVVTSLAAMIMSKWPQLTGVDAGNIILSTARDIGDEGVDEVFGHGLVDAYAALSPIEPTLSNGKASSVLNGAAMFVSDVFSNGPQSIEPAFEEVTILDKFGRDFSGDISSLIVRPSQRDLPWLRRRVEAQHNAGSTGFVTARASATIGYTAFETEHRDASGNPVLQNRLTNAALALRTDEMTTITAGFNSSDNIMDDILGMAPTSDAMFAYNPIAQTSVGLERKMGSVRLSVYGQIGRRNGASTSGLAAGLREGHHSLKLGLISETGSVFGTPVGTGAMRFGDGAKTVFVEAATGFDLKGWEFDGYASVGATKLKLAGDTLLTSADTISTGRFGVTASTQALGGTASFGIAQKLIALSGDATFTLGHGYDLQARDLTYARHEVSLRSNLAPQLTFGYRKQGERSGFSFGAASTFSARDARVFGTYRLRLN
ncbi:S8 family peptidase [Qipengyuania sp. NPDC077410]|uniref:S8 family peptidase n=1 Tax=Qipengyuania sp. NPDC077410 TaxID=3364496 RepID=UPI0037CC7CAC